MLLLLLLFLLFARVSAVSIAEPPPVESDVAPAAVASPEATPVVPVAASCAIAPRTVGAVNEIVTADDIARATPVADAIPYVAPDGVPADAATVAAIDATVQEMIACINTGDFLRFLALFTNDGLRRLAADFEFPIETDDPDLTPQPANPDDLLAAATDEVILLAGGRVSALVRAFSAVDQEPEEFALHLILVRSPDQTRWLIDEFVPVTIDTPTATTWTPVRGPRYEGVIVAAAAAVEFAAWFIDTTAATGWQPTENDVATLEAALPAFLAAAERATPRMKEELGGYLRQYAGVVDESGARLIVVNLFCTDAGSDWQSQPVFVLDGGDCFWSVVWNADAASFDRLMVNGDA